MPVGLLHDQVTLMGSQPSSYELMLTPASADQTRMPAPTARGRISCKAKLSACQSPAEPHAPPAGLFHHQRHLSMQQSLRATNIRD